jgi:transcriptional regulator with AAA-type ATPase domain
VVLLYRQHRGNIIRSRHSDEALQVLAGYSRPGNFPELQQALDHALLRCSQEKQLQAFHLPDYIHSAARGTAGY